jgi:hypothetical protein
MQNSKPRLQKSNQKQPDLVLKLLEEFGHENEHLIKQLMHREFNNNRSRYANLTYEHFQGLLRDKLAHGSNRGSLRDLQAKISPRASVQ